MKFAVFDFEALNWNELYAIGYYDGTNYVKHFAEAPDNYEIVEKLFYILEQLKVKDDTILYAHNGGKYDFLPIMAYCLDNGIEISPDIVINGRVAKMSIMAKYKDNNAKLAQLKPLWKFRDSYTLLPASLKRLTKAYNVEHSKQYVEDYSKYVPEEYLEHDCKGLYEVLEAFFKTYSDQLSNPLKNPPLTISSAAQRLYFEKYNADNQHNLCATEPYIENKVRKSYYGGRTEIFNMLYEGDKTLQYYDVNSLYPSVMFGHDYPTGEYDTVYHYISPKDLLGVFDVTWKSPTIYAPILPYRDEINNKLIFPLSNKARGWYTNIELEKALSFGYDFNVHSGIVWEHRMRMFDEYVKYFYDIKKKGKGATRELAKLMLNSLYGKFGQRREHQTILVGEKLYKYQREHPNTPIQMIGETGQVGYFNETSFRNTKIMPHIASFVTSYARIKLYSYFEKCNFDLYYTDTDSILTTKKIQTSDELGDVKLEYEIDQAYFLLPKTYAFHLTKPIIREHPNGDTEEIWKVAKMKGFSFNDFSLEDYRKAVTKGTLKQFEEKRTKVLGFKESLARHEQIFKTKKVTKTISAIYNKRLIMRDFSTAPLRI